VTRARTLGAGLVTVLLAGCGLAGCATSTARGQFALSRGDYASAVQEFDAALADNPDRVDALIGLGIARYKLAEYPGAREALERALARSAREPLARLYLGLTELQAGNIPRAVEDLRTFRTEPLDPRVAALVDRSLPILESPMLTREVRSLIATTLEDEVSLARELEHARLVASAPPPFARPYPLYYDCVAVRHGRIVCF